MRGRKKALPGFFNWFAETKLGLGQNIAEIGRTELCPSLTAAVSSFYGFPDPARLSIPAIIEPDGVSLKRKCCWRISPSRVGNQEMPVVQKVSIYSRDCRFYDRGKSRRLAASAKIIAGSVCNSDWASGKVFRKGGRTKSRRYFGWWISRTHLG